MNENVTATTPWNDRDGKVEIFQKVMKYLHDNPTEYTRCLDDKAGQDILIEACKNMTRPLVIPPGARVVFLPHGDNLRGDPRPSPPPVIPPVIPPVPPPVIPAELSAPPAESSSARALSSAELAQMLMHAGGIPYNAGSSLIISLPPWELIRDKPEDPLLLAYACSYIIW